MRTAPNLTHLEVSLNKREVLPFPQSPTLVFLKIEKVSFDIDHSHAEIDLPSLRSLGVSVLLQPDWPLIRTLIRRSSKLETLQIEDLKCDIPEEGDLSRKIEIEALRYLRLWDVERAPFLSRMNGIVANNLQRMDVKIETHAPSQRRQGAKWIRMLADAERSTPLHSLLRRLVPSKSMRVDFVIDKMRTTCPIHSYDSSLYGVGEKREFTFECGFDLPAMDEDALPFWVRSAPDDAPDEAPTNYWTEFCSFDYNIEAC